MYPSNFARAGLLTERLGLSPGDSRYYEFAVCSVGHRFVASALGRDGR